MLFYSSLTRISPLRDVAWTLQKLPREEWAAGDYLLCEAEVRGYDHLELETGRMATLVSGDRFIGALGDREATLEATGSWREVGEDLLLDLLTGAGLLGKMTSKSPFLPKLMHGHYHGHVMVAGEKATMRRFVPEVPKRAFTTPAVLLLGTSMSAGKTTAGQAIVRRLSALGQRVVALKLAGAGRYRDVLHMQDAGAEWIFDFVDGGLPSTVAPEADYRPVLEHVLSMAAAVEADVAVVEIGASPLAAYNGMVALDAVRDVVRFTVLAASDVYGVLGFQQLVGVKPDVVAGPTANTKAGIDLVSRHAGIEILNMSDQASNAALDRLLRTAFDITE